MIVFLEHEHRFAIHTRIGECIDQFTFRSDLGIGLSDLVELLFHGRKIDDLIGQLALLNLAVWAFDKAILVHPRMRGERVDQTNVRAFRRLNRAAPTIMGRVHVARLKTGALTRQTTRAER